MLCGCGHMQADKRLYQMELVNREQNYNKLFSANPVVGVLDPLAAKDKVRKCVYISVCTSITLPCTRAWVCVCTTSQNFDHSLSDPLFPPARQWLTLHVTLCGTIWTKHVYLSRPIATCEHVGKLTYSISPFLSFPLPCAWLRRRSSLKEEATSLPAGIQVHHPLLALILSHTVLAVKQYQGRYQ